MNSTMIEDEDLGEDVALLVLVEGGKEAIVGDVQLTNLLDAYSTIGEFATDPSVRIDNGLIRVINSMIVRGMPGERRGGRFRSGPAAIVDGRTREIRYRPPPPGARRFAS